MTKKINNTGLKMKTTTIGLTKKQVCYLGGLSKTSKFSGGRKISRMAIIRSLLLACKDFEIDVSGVKSEQELYERVLSAFDRHK
jgi:hypothetical protein